MEDAARIGGYHHFNWVQVVTKDDATSNPLFFPSVLLGGLSYCLPGYVGGGWIATSCDYVPTVPYFDPPRGGYVYQGASELRPGEDNLDWYDDEQYTNGPVYVLADHLNTFTQLEQDSCHLDANGAICPGNPHELDFFDFPTVSKPPVIPSPVLELEVQFSTSLVGVWPDGTGDVLNLASCETGADLSCLNVSGTSFNWHALGGVVGITQTRSSTNPSSASGTTVYFDGFRPPGAAGFSQPELELFAKSGIRVRDEAGVVIPVMIDINPGRRDPARIDLRSRDHLVAVEILTTTTFDAPTQVDATSLRFGRTGQEKSLAFCEREHRQHHGAGHDDETNSFGHRHRDLLCHFYLSKTGFEVGDTEGILKGQTLSGTSIFGRDSIVVVAPRWSR